MISNFTELKAAVALYLHRTDMDAQIPDFITMAESSIANEVRLRDQVTISSAVTVPGQPYVALPADWLQFVYVSRDSCPLQYITPDALRSLSKESGNTSRYSIEGARLLLNPTPSGADTIDFAYYARIPALSVTPTNFLLTKHPQIYLSKALSWAFKFIMSEPQSSAWDAIYSQAIADAKSAENASLVSGSPLSIRVR